MPELYVGLSIINLVTCMWEDHFQVYTDGSNPNRKREVSIQERKPLLNSISVFTAETVACLWAL